MRDKFYMTDPIPVVDLKLDVDNFRHYGQLETQQDCINVIISDNHAHFLALAEDLASIGLTPQHIIVSAKHEGRWVVRDGNRRVAALKCLNNPSCCGNKFVRKKIAKIADEHSVTLPHVVICLCSADDESIYQYMERLHGGQLEGVGQKGWGPDGKASFDIHRGRPSANAFAQALINWVRREGVKVSNKIYITTLTRMLGPKTRDLLGLDWDGEKVSCADAKMLLKVMTKVITDIDSGGINVDTVRTWNGQKDYLEKVLDETGSERPSSQIPLTPVASGKETNNKKTSKQKNTEKNRPTPKPLWDRKHLIPAKTSVKSPPEGRAKNAYVELKAGHCMDIRVNPNATALLFRAFWEWSVDNYISNQKLAVRGDELKQRFWAVVLDLERRGEIDKDQKQLLEQKKNHDQMISISSMNKWVHSTHFHPSPQTLCMFWDEVEFFIAECWK